MGHAVWRPLRPTARCSTRGIPSSVSARCLRRRPAIGIAAAERHDDVRDVDVRAVELSIDLDAAPASAGDVYLRLHLLSNRLCAPRTINLDESLRAAGRTSRGPTSVRSRSIRSTRCAGRCVLAGEILTVHGLDKLPRMTDYVVPSGVRIADADRVRLGAHLAPGTTVMHEGFVNFNAGTLGRSMVEGRISAGVIVGDGSDIGGGASIMGTLSGGGKDQITIGERCLLGAEAGIGISLGDECVVEAGLYVTAGTLVKMPDGEVVKARQLSGAERPAVPAQQPDRCRRGDPPLRRVGRAQRRFAPQRLSIARTIPNHKRTSE